MSGPRAAAAAMAGALALALAGCADPRTAAETATEAALAVECERAEAALAAAWAASGWGVYTRPELIRLGDLDREMRALCSAPAATALATARVGQIAGEAASMGVR